MIDDDAQPQQDGVLDSNPEAAKLAAVIRLLLDAPEDEEGHEATRAQARRIASMTAEEVMALGQQQAEGEEEGDEAEEEEEEGGGPEQEARDPGDLLRFLMGG